MGDAQVGYGYSPFRRLSQNQFTIEGFGIAATSAVLQLLYVQMLADNTSFIYYFVLSVTFPTLVVDLIKHYKIT